MILNTPSAISPDNLKDSIVELRYDSSIPFEVLLGLVYKALDETYQYTNQPLARQDSGTIVTGNALQIGTGIGQKIFFNDSIKLELRPNSLIFNCLDKYIGWKNYYLEIAKTLNQLMAVQEVGNVRRIGMRYISEYINAGIDTNTRFSFGFGIPEIKSDAYQFRTEFKWETNERVILNLNHNAQVVVPFPNGTEKILPFATIDIDVINESLNLSKLDEILNEINRIHQIEKNVFFTLLKPEYLNTLNPVYE